MPRGVHKEGCECVFCQRKAGNTMVIDKPIVPCPYCREDAYKPSTTGCPVVTHNKGREGRP